MPYGAYFSYGSVLLLYGTCSPYGTYCPAPYGTYYLDGTCSTYDTYNPTVTYSPSTALIVPTVLIAPTVLLADMEVLMPTGRGGRAGRYLYWILHGLCTYTVVKLP